MTDSGMGYLADAIKLIARAVVIVGCFASGRWSQAPDAVRLLENK